MVALFCCVVEFLHVANGNVRLPVACGSNKLFQHGGMEDIVAVKNHEIGRVNLSDPLVACSAGTDAWG